jgi:tetratricopeptide (TPR) repeat protein
MQSLRAAIAAGLLTFAATELNAAEAALLYAEGAYEAAIAAAESDGGAAGFALAARAALADAELRETPCLACLERAAEFARGAIAAGPDNAEPYIYLVVALGRRARLIGFFQAQSERIGSVTDEAIEAALAIDPDYPWALATRGGWHIEVVRLAGRILGGFLFGAAVEDGKDFFRRAMAGEPDNLVLPYQYALTLSAYDLEGERQAIRAELAKAVVLDPQDAYESAIRMRAELLLAELDAGDDPNFLRLLDIFRGDP